MLRARLLRLTDLGVVTCATSHLRRLKWTVPHDGACHSMLNCRITTERDFSAPEQVAPTSYPNLPHTRLKLALVSTREARRATLPMSSSQYVWRASHHPFSFYNVRFGTLYGLDSFANMSFCSQSNIFIESINIGISAM